jgi:thiosulfate/3-mercaptopyruvate sulfurtransferase
MQTGIPHVRRNLGGFPNKALILIVTALIFCLSSPIVSAFASPLGLIEPLALNQNLSGWVILDARPKSAWLAGHIPGALSFSWENYTRTDEDGVPYRVWPPEELARQLGKMGINENSPIAVYGDADSSWGGEGWDCWVLSWLGHKGPIRLVAGGIRAWKNNKLPVKEGVEQTKSRPGRYQFKVNPGLDITTAELERERAAVTLIDTRSTLEWLRGRIPGATHIQWTEFYSGAERRPLSADALKKLLQKEGIDVHKPIVYYCAGGIRSAYAWMVHQLAGLPPARNYEGGFEAWKKLSHK